MILKAYLLKYSLNRKSRELTNSSNNEDRFHQPAGILTQFISFTKIHNNTPSEEENTSNKCFFRSDYKLQDVVKYDGKMR